ncbi:MAG: DUF1015 domain-containing protein [Sedimentisphaerales bacterium]|nr:DUF1015 domain-containing protein [Sedimentisphaerales bacterium]
MFDLITWDVFMKIRSFRAFRFDSAVVGDSGDCIAPPYDVINADQQESLYEKNDYNIVRIIRAKTSSSDTDADNQYTRARDYLDKWISDGALKQDSTEAVYAYVQDYDLGETHLQRLTFIALAELEDFGDVVKPHEEILSKPMQDRLNLTKATDAQLGLVFMLYNDPGQTAEKIIENAASETPLIDFTDDQDVRHRLFAITGEDDVGAIVKMMRDKSVIIADGHHRYTTGLTYARQSSNPAAKYQMLAFTNMAHEGLIVLATHRLVANLDDFSMAKLLAGLAENFDLTTLSFTDDKSKADAKQKALAEMKAQMDKDNSAFVIYGPDSAFHLAVLKDHAVMDAAVPDRSEAYRSLDVAVLHKLILEDILGIDQDRRAKGENLQYVKDTPNAIDDSIAQVDAGQKQAAFFMNPIKMSQLIGVTDAGERMPQKSTYFYPKMFTGLTINKL